MGGKRGIKAGSDTFWSPFKKRSGPYNNLLLSYISGRLVLLFLTLCFCGPLLLISLFFFMGSGDREAMVFTRVMGSLFVILSFLPFLLYRLLVGYLDTASVRGIQRIMEGKKAGLRELLREIRANFWRYSMWAIGCTFLKLLQDILILFSMALLFFGIFYPAKDLEPEASLLAGMFLLTVFAFFFFVIIYPLEKGLFMMIYDRACIRFSLGKKWSVKRKKERCTISSPKEPTMKRYLVMLSPVMLIYGLICFVLFYLMGVPVLVFIVLASPVISLLSRTYLLLIGSSTSKK